MNQKLIKIFKTMEQPTKVTIENEDDSQQ